MFKKGDKVRRTMGSHRNVVVGGVYTVSHFDAQRYVISIEGDQNGEYTPDYFELVESVRGTTLPVTAEERKNIPLMSGFMAYFPAAMAAVAALSKKGNDQHNPGQPLHWARSKSGDHEDCLLRHLLESGTIDTDGVRHTTKVAWRAMALLQMELEREEGAPVPKGAG